MRLQGKTLRRILAGFLLFAAASVPLKALVLMSDPLTGAEHLTTSTTATSTSAAAGSISTASIAPIHPPGTVVPERSLAALVQDPWGTLGQVSPSAAALKAGIGVLAGLSSGLLGIGTWDNEQ